MLTAIAGAALVMNLDFAAGYWGIGQLKSFIYLNGLARMVQSMSQIVDESLNKHFQVTSSMGKFFLLKSQSDMRDGMASYTTI